MAERQEFQSLDEGFFISNDTLEKMATSAFEFQSLDEGFFISNQDHKWMLGGLHNQFQSLDEGFFISNKEEQWEDFLTGCVSVP